MRYIFRNFVNCFLFILVLTGCGSGSVSNSTGPSSLSGIVMNVEANPKSVSSGGSATITVTLTFSNGTPAAGQTVNAVSGSGGSISAATGTTDSNGQAFFSVVVTSPVTVTFTVENISVSIRINVNG